MAIFSSAPATNGGVAVEQHNRRRGGGMPLSIIAKDLTVIGDLETDGVVKIEGRVRGNIRAGGQVLVSPGAVVEGDLHTREAVIAGQVHGAIHASERVELQASADVHGDINTQRIAIVEGGRVSGAVRMEVDRLVLGPSNVPELLSHNS
jgi:cytoskeletal protein CcmA (bactofilin family)